MAINKRVYAVLRDGFEDILKRGELPKVNARFHNDRLQGYYLMEHSLAWAQFCKIVNERLMRSEEEGVFTKKYNKAFLEKVENFACDITGEQVIAQGDNRFQTMWD